MDISTWGGILIGVGAILLGNILEDGSIGSLLQLTSAVIVFGGTLGATLVSNSWPDVKMALRLLRSAFFDEDHQAVRTIAQEIIAASQLARKESILALEKQLNKFTSSYMRNVFKYMIDGIQPDALRKMFEPEMEISELKQLSAAKVWSDAGGFAPTIGIIGAILGLIHVMANLSETSALGKGIAVAFVATIYGVGSANLFFIPIANKIRRRIRAQKEIKQMIVEGATSISQGLTPYIVEEKMKAYLQNIVETKAKA